MIALQEKLEREAAGLKAKLNEADERTAKVWTLWINPIPCGGNIKKITEKEIFTSLFFPQESKALAARLEAEKKALADQLESGNKEVAERMQMEEERRKREADELKVIYD